MLPSLPHIEMMSTPKKMVEKTLESMETLKKNGANVYQVKNLWLNKKNPYNGINTFVQDMDGNKFEVQYHTKASYVAKEKTHKLYEDIRKGNLSSEDIQKLTEEMQKVFDSVKVPKGIERVKSHG